MEGVNLYDWVFRFNPYTKEWLAAKRDDYNLLFSDTKSEKVLKSTEVSTLVYIIKHTNGNVLKLNNLVYEPQGLS